MQMGKSLCVFIKIISTSVITTNCFKSYSSYIFECLDFLEAPLVVSIAPHSFILGDCTLLVEMIRSISLLAIVLLLVSFLSESQANKDGVPVNSCTSMDPNHGVAAQTTSPPFNTTVEMVWLGYLFFKYASSYVTFLIPYSDVYELGWLFTPDY